MFETAEIGHRLDKETYKKESPTVREALLAVQKELSAAKLSVVMLMCGVEGGGKSETVNLLLEWMDARGIHVHAFGSPSDEERERSHFWRYWRMLPRHGHIGILISAWYTHPIIDHVFGEIDDDELDETLDRIVSFEHMLANENTLILKFWLHLSKKEQTRRFKKMEKDPATSWRVTKEDWKFAKRYDEFRSVCETALRKTDTAEVPWHIIEATDHQYRNLTVARATVEAIRKALDRAKEKQPASTPELPVPKKVNIIRSLDLTRTVSKKDYDERLPRLQGKLSLLTRKLYERQRSVILVFEGPDAAGKGGAIRRLTHAMDARNYQVMPVAAPTEEERAHPYLWRFWRHLPRLGRVTIYDRSWYGRVLVERLEGYCRPSDWQRAYSEINDFEWQLADFGIILIKFWLAISPQEQLKRFKDRSETPFKQYKIGPDDWRNRAKWDAYEAAACDMVERTSARHAPWVLIEANDKRHARLKVLKTVVERLSEALD